MEISTLSQSTTFPYFIILFLFYLFCFQIELDRRKGRMKLLTDVPFASGEGRDRAFELISMGVVLLIAFIEVLLFKLFSSVFLLVALVVFRF